MKHTQGKAEVHHFGDNGNRQTRVHIDNVTLAKVSQIDEAQANVELIAEAFNVTNESGLTPRQLLEQRNVLLDAVGVFLKSECAKSEIPYELYKNLKEAINHAKNKQKWQAETNLI